MKRAFFKSKAFRLAVVFSSLIAGVILLFAILFIATLQRNIRQRQSRELVRSCSYVSKKYASGQTINVPYFVGYVIYNENKEMIATNDPFLPLLPHTNEKARRYFKKNFYTDGALNILYATSGFKNSGGEKLYVQCSINMDRDFNQHVMKEFVHSLLFLALPLLLVSFASSFFITKQTMKPVKKMTQDAGDISSENLDNEFEVTGSGDEFDLLALSFNKMFKKLKLDFEREKQFTSDVSHELKTPVAVILGHANLIRRWGKDNPEQLEKSLGRLTKEVHSIEAIVENLLKLSRLETGSIKPNFAEVNVAEIFQRLEDDTLCWAPHVRFTKNVSCKFPLKCDEELLYEALTIVVSNSVKFCREDSCDLALEYNESDGVKKISVTDNGPGISAEALSHVFERFYRGDQSHNRSKGGSGLGLAIVQNIMAVHKGTVKALSDGQSWTRMEFGF